MTCQQLSGSNGMTMCIGVKQKFLVPVAPRPKSEVWCTITFVSHGKFDCCGLNGMVQGVKNWSWCGPVLWFSMLNLVTLVQTMWANLGRSTPELSILSLACQGHSGLLKVAHWVLSVTRWLPGSDLPSYRSVLYSFRHKRRHLSKMTIFINHMYLMLLVMGYRQNFVILFVLKNSWCPYQVAKKSLMVYTAVLIQYQSLTDAQTVILKSHISINILLLKSVYWIRRWQQWIKVHFEDVVS